MPGIPDHPVIRNMEATGYPHPIKEYIVNCEDCGEELTGTDRQQGDLRQKLRNDLPVPELYGLCRRSQRDG